MQHNLRALSLFLLASVPWPLCAQAKPRQPGQPTKAPGAHSATHQARVKKNGEEAKGTLNENNVYKNRLLDLTLALPGEWQFLDDDARDQAEGRTGRKQNSEAPACKGPLCGDPEINVALVRNAEGRSTSSTIFVTGFKLAPEYLDRGHYPLRHFAETMLPASSGKGGVDSGSDLNAIQLGGRPAYRVVVSKPTAKEPTEAGYLTESNGYVVLLICTAESSSELPGLQSAIENVQFMDSPVQQP